MAEKKWVIGQRSVYKDGFKDGFDKALKLATLKILIRNIGKRYETGGK